MRRDRIIMLLALASACDFGVDLTGLSDGSIDADAASDVVLDVPTPQVPMVAIGLGSSHSCAVGQDGSVLCWGSNSYGQLGNGSGFDSSTPTPVALTTKDVVQVAGGQYHTCAVEQSGTVLCWGRNDQGQLGDGSGSASSRVPVAAQSISNAVQVATSASSSCAVLMDGSVSCWGANGNGEIGQGTTTISHYPTPQAIPNLTDVVAIRGAIGGNHFCALTKMGTVSCWGQNGNGQLGNASNTDSATPVQPTLPGVVNDLAAGAAHTCVVITGAVYCFGSNSNGQLGNEQTNDSNVPVTGDPMLLAPVSHLAAGGAFTCGSTTTGMMCWGSGYAGQLGNGKTVESTVPVTVATPPVTAVAAGSVHACALMSTGAVECWGFDANGRLGVGRPLMSTTPVSVLGLGSVVDLAVGGDHACARSAEAGVVCWGDNTSSQLGTSSGTLPAASTPQPAAEPIVSGLALGTSHSCGLGVDGGAYCFGSNYNGQFGTGGTGGGVGPTRFGGATGGFTATAVASGSVHVCAIATAGTVSCAGSNGSGQLGDNTTSTSYSLVTVLGVDGGPVGAVKTLISGPSDSCATTSAPEAGTTLLCWGANGSGEIGLGVIKAANVATPVSVFADAGLPSSMALGGAHTCVVRNDGTVLCWGAGANGQLGNGMGMDSVNPVKALTSLPALSVAAGANHTCAILNDHSVECWGYAVFGEVGNGSTANAFAPVAVMGITNAVALRALADTTCALLSDGTVKCWGAAPDGQLGDGAAVVVPSPAFAHL